MNPPPPMTRYCREPGCGARIVYARTEAMKWQPLNADPDPDGNVAVQPGGQGGLLFARTLKAGEGLGGAEKRMMPHAATCTVGRDAKKPATTAGNVIQFADLAARRAARLRVKTPSRGRR